MGSHQSQSTAQQDLKLQSSNSHVPSIADIAAKYYPRQDNTFTITNYPTLPKIWEYERVSVSYTSSTDKDLSAQFLFQATSHYKWKTNTDTIYMTDIDIICRESLKEINITSVYVGLIDKLNNHVHGVVFHATLPWTHNDKSPHQMFEAGGYMYIGKNYKPETTGYKIRPGFIGAGFSLESIDKPLHFVRIVGNRLILAKRRLQYSETLEEWCASATFSLSDITHAKKSNQKVIASALNRETVHAFNDGSSKNGYYLHTNKPNSEIYYMFEIEYVDIPLRSRYKQDYFYLYNGFDPQQVVYCNTEYNAMIGTASESALLRVAPGLEHGTISFESVLYPGHFLSVTSSGVIFTKENNSFQILPGYLGENSYRIYCPKTSNYVMAHEQDNVHRLIFMRSIPSCEYNRRKATFGIRRIPEV